MKLAIAKIIFAAIIISFASWLAGKKTSLAGFITALPLTTLLALAFSHMEWGDARQSVNFAKSIFVAVPITLLFFLPFLLAQKLQLGFWQCYVSGVALLGIGYFFHSYLFKNI
jgi:hypothetical protein